MDRYISIRENRRCFWTATSSMTVWWWVTRVIITITTHISSQTWMSTQWDITLTTQISMIKDLIKWFKTQSSTAIGWTKLLTATFLDNKINHLQFGNKQLKQSLMIVEKTSVSKASLTVEGAQVLYINKEILSKSWKMTKVNTLQRLNRSKTICTKSRIKRKATSNSTWTYPVFK